MSQERSLVLYKEWERALNERSGEVDLDLIASLENEALAEGIDLWQINNTLLNGLTAAPDFNPDLHPRGRDGKFINVLGLVRIFDFKDRSGKRTPEASGEVKSISPTGQKGNPDIEVELPGGELVTVKPSQIAAHPDVKARLDAPDPDSPTVQDMQESFREGVPPSVRDRYLAYQEGERSRGVADRDMLDLNDWLDQGEPGGMNQIGEPITVEEGELGSKGNPIKTSDPLEAVTALHEGKYVELETVDQVSTLLNELARIANEAKAAGVDAPNYDLCLVTVPNTNLFCAESKGIPRIQMPQLGGQPVPGSRADALPKNDNGEVDIGPQFVEHLRDQGIGVENKRKLASHLKASQSELVGPKVAGMMKAMESGNENAIRNIREASIFVTKDGYVVDGHHRWAAVVGLDAAEGGLDDLDMPIQEIDMEILDVLEEANRFAIAMGVPPQAAV